MSIFVRAVITGFGVSLGSALFKKIAPRLGLAPPGDKEEREQIKRTVTTEPITDS
jgi:hypothetical protein